MKIININRRQVNQVEVALPFETDEQVIAAWSYLVKNRSFFDFDYRPDSEGEDDDRAFIDVYLECLHNGYPITEPGAALIRRLIPKIWQAEMSYDIRELIGASV